MSRAGKIFWIIIGMLVLLFIVTAYYYILGESKKPKQNSCSISSQNIDRCKIQDFNLTIYNPQVNDELINAGIFGYNNAT